MINFERMIAIGTWVMRTISTGEFNVEVHGDRG
jgi:hypothetical protein